MEEGVVYMVINSYDGTNALFKEKSRAASFKKEERVRLHETLCIKKEVPSKCWCCTPSVKECAAHVYARTVKEHAIGACAFYNDVSIEEKELL